MGKEQQQFSTDWLPEGWKVQVSRRKTGKIDRCYIDPSNEHKFNSKPEVLRYLKKAGVDHSIREESEAKTTCQSSAALVEKKVNTAESPAKFIKEPSVTDKGNESSGHSLAAESEEKVAGCKSEQHTVNKQSLIIGAGQLKNNDQAPSKNLKEGVEAAKARNKKRKNVKVDDLPRRASRRIAGIEADDVSLEPPTVLTRPRRSAGKRPSHSEVDSSAEKGEKPADSEEQAKRLSPEHESKNQNVEVVLDVPTSESKNQNVEVVLDVPFSELLNDPCIEFAIKTLTGAMPLPTEDEKPVTSLNQGSSSTLPEVVADEGPDLFQPPTDIWADPCFEFAVKTLTGDLPVDTEPAMEANAGVQSAPQPKNKQMSSTSTALR